MIGDRNVLVAVRFGRPRHLVDRVRAVAPPGVHLQIPADVFQLNEGGQPSPLGQLDLALILADLRRDPRQPDRGVDLLFGPAGDAAVVLDGEHAILIDLQALLHRFLPQLDVVILAAGKILQRGAEGFGLHHPHVRLDAGIQHDAGPRGPLGQHLLYLPEGREDVHHGLGCRAGDEDINIPDRLLHPPEAPGHAGLRDLLHTAQRGDEFLRMRQDLADR